MPDEPPLVSVLSSMSTHYSVHSLAHRHRTSVGEGQRLVLATHCPGKDAPRGREYLRFRPPGLPAHPPPAPPPRASPSSPSCTVQLYSLFVWCVARTLLVGDLGRAWFTKYRIWTECNHTRDESATRMNDVPTPHCALAGAAGRDSVLIAMIAVEC